jgi:hypothetical protein
MKPLATRVHTTLYALKTRLLLRTRAKRVWDRARQSRLGFRSLYDLVVDLRYGGSCAGCEPNPFAERGAVQIQSTHYAVLSDLFRKNRIEIDESDVLVDVGCGKGRVLNYWLACGLKNRMIGLELVGRIARKTQARLARFPNVTIVAGDAVANVPPEGTLFYLYNPFGEETMREFADALLKTVRSPERLRIVYLNSRRAGVFTSDPRWHVTSLRTGLPEEAVMVTVAASGDH